MINEIIPLGNPDIREEDIEAAASVLRTGMLIQGSHVKQLESNIENFTSVSNCTAVSSGTAALHLALLALEIEKGDEVIVPALSFIATANVVEVVGAKSIFVDIDPVYNTILVGDIEKKITSKTKAIIAVHEFGLCADMPSILAIAKKHDIPVLEDAACAIGSKIKEKFAGTFGEIGTFSLHPRKAITSGEGGIVVTNDHRLGNLIKTLRNHGIKFDSNPIRFSHAGLNYRLTDFQAALVNSQFQRFDKALSKKAKLAEIYLNSIQHPALKLPEVPNDFVHSWQTFHLLVEDNHLRNKLIKSLADSNIFTNYGAQCIPYMSYYQKKYNHNVEVEFPNALRAYECGLAIPLYDKLTEKQVLDISKIINKFK